MLQYLYVEVNAVGIFLLLIIVYNQRQSVGSSMVQRQFNMLVYATIAMLAVDAACWLLDGAAFQGGRFFKTLAETLYYALNIIIPFLWVVYLEIAISKERKATVRKLRYLSIPMILLLIYIVVNLQTHSIFIIDENNVYHRNSGFFAFFVASYGYLAYASVRALRAAHRAAWKDDKRQYFAMAFFMVPPAVGGIIQTFAYGISVIWICVALSIMLMYIDSLNHQISADPLTGINNRRELNKYILRETKNPGYVGILALIMMDVDNFKRVNDTHGHYYGDTVLLAVSEILKKSCKNTAAFLARYGGDEFCIVYPAENLRAVLDIIDRIRENVEHWNEKHGEPVNLGLSIGYSAWQPDTDINIDQLYHRADQEMYRAKNAKRGNS